MNRISKMFFLGLAVVALAGFGKVGVTKAAAQPGSLIKMNGLSSVYYLGQDGKRYVFPNQTTYFSWYKDFSGVVTISQSELESYPLGSNITMRPGTYLVKITTNPKVYAVEPGGLLRAIPDEAAAKALYGDNWAKRVVDVPDAFFTNYKMGTALAAGEIPAGALVKNANNADVYYFDGTNYRKIADEAAFNANRFSFDNVMTLSNTITAGGTAITANEFANPDSSATNTGVQPGQGTGLTVALSASTAPATTLIKNQALADLASFNLTASSDGMVALKTVKLRRIGISSDAALSNIYLYEGNTRLTDNASLSSGYVTFSNSNGIINIPAGTTKNITVKADISGETGNIGMQIEAASHITTVSGTTITGSFPVSGNLMSMTKADDLAEVRLSGMVDAGANINAGTMNATLWSTSFQVTNKAVDLKNIIFKQVGSIPADAVQNLSLYVNGVRAGNIASITSDNRVNFDLTASPVRLNTGSTNIELRGDIVKGSDRSFSFNLQTVSDAVLTDTNYNVNVAIIGAIPSTQSTTINAGSVSITTDSSFNATEVVKNASGATFMKYTMKAFGENVRVNSLRVTPAFTFAGAAAGEKINDLAIFVNGAQVGSSQSWTTGGAAKDFGTSNLFTIEAGQTVTVEIRGSLDLPNPTNATKIKADLTVLQNKLEGVTSYKTSPSIDTDYLGRDLDIVAGSMTVSYNTGLQNQNVSKNTSNVKVGSYILKAGSSEGVRVTNLRVDVKGTAELVKLANLYISENNTPVLPQAQNNFPVNFTLNANETKTIDVYVDLGDLANGRTIITDLTATGLTIPSNSSISVADVDGQTMTVQTGSLAIPTLVSNSPVAKLVTGGSSNELVATYKFVATNSNIRLDDLKFKVAKHNNDANGTAIQSLTVNGVTAPAVLVGGDYVVSLNGLNVNIPAGTQGMNVEIKANFNNVTSDGQGGSATNNDVKLILTDYKYVVGNTTLTDSATVPSNTMILVAGAPVVTDSTPTGTGNTLVAGANNEVMRFSVTAQNGMVNLKQIAVAAVSSYALSNAKVWIYDADDMATALNGVGGTALIDGNTIQTGATTVVEFSNDYTINAGGVKTFVVKVDNTGVTASGDYFRMDLTNGNDILNTNNNWKWNDGTIGTYINSYLVKTLPITGKTFTRN